MNNIIDALRPYLTLNIIGDRATCNCPFCMDKDRMMILSAKTNDFKCFTCGETGDAAYFIRRLQEMQDVKYVDAKLFDNPTKEEDPYKQKLLAINNEAGKFFYKQLIETPKAFNYFAQREITKGVIQHFGLGYASEKKDSLYKYLLKLGYNKQEIMDAGLITVSAKGYVFDRFQDRVMFPIINTDGDVVGFGGRRLDDTNTELAKYVNSPETAIFNKSDNLYGLNFAQKSQIAGMILCEGYMDVIALQKSGFVNSVASLGTAFNENHVRLLRKFTDTVYLCFDNDQAGINAKLKAIPLLRKHGFEVNVIDLSPHKDPDEFIKALGTTEFANRASTSMNSYCYEIGTILQAHQYNIDSEGFLKEIGEKIASAPDRETEEYIKAFNKIKNDHLELYSNFEAHQAEAEEKTEADADENVVRIQNIEDDSRVDEQNQFSEQDTQTEQNTETEQEQESEDYDEEGNDDIFGFNDFEVVIY